MISIVVCSRPSLIEVLLKNIKNTIGVVYEVITINNSNNQYSIFEAYNIGISQSNVIFEDISIGPVGVAGAKLKTKMPSAWWDCPEDLKAMYLFQHSKNKEKQLWNIGFEESNLVEVVAIDGVFYGYIKKEIHFDAQLTGFHNYDLICLLKL